MIKILRSALVALVAVLLAGYWSSSVSAQSPTEVEIHVSSTKGAPGTIVSVPVYIDPSTEFETEMVELDIFWDRKTLKFKDIVTDDRTALAFANGYAEEIARLGKVYLEFTFDAPHLFKAEIKPLFFLTFEVVGEKGAVGFLRAEKISFGGANVTVAVQNAEFHVLPTAIYYNDRDHIEITSSEVFTSFELELTGELEFAVAESNWVFEQNGDFITGQSPDPEQGATTVTVPVSTENVVVYSLKLDDGEVVQFAERPAELVKLFVPLLRSDH